MENLENGTDKIIDFFKRKARLTNGVYNDTKRIKELKAQGFLLENDSDLSYYTESEEGPLFL